MKKDSEEKITLRIKEICKAKQLTLKEVASRMNIAPESLTRAITGNPTLSTLKHLADTLDVDITDLFYRTKPSSQINAVICWGTQVLMAENLAELRDIVHRIESALNINT